MPFTNGRFYMNPAYGRALERAREADSQRERTSNPHKPQEQGQDAHWVTIDGRHVLIGEAPAGPRNNTDPIRNDTPRTIARQFVNPTPKSPTGSITRRPACARRRCTALAALTT